MGRTNTALTAAIIILSCPLPSYPVYSLFSQTLRRNLITDRWQQVEGADGTMHRQCCGAVVLVSMLQRFAKDGMGSFDSLLHLFPIVHAIEHQVTSRYPVDCLERMLP